MQSTTADRRYIAKTLVPTIRQRLVKLPDEQKIEVLNQLAIELGNMVREYETDSDTCPQCKQPVMVCTC